MLTLVIANNLTSWGFQDCARDTSNGAFGAALPKLLFRHLPRHYAANSTYALYPFYTPHTAKRNLAALEKKGIIQCANLYHFDRPKGRSSPKVVDTLLGIRHILSDPTAYKTMDHAELGLLSVEYDMFDGKLTYS